MINIDHLEKLARESTPGPWIVEGVAGSIINRHADAAFIASASPDVILKLCAVVRAARELTTFLDDDLGMDKPQLTWMRQALAELEARE